MNDKKQLFYVQDYLWCLFTANLSQNLGMMEETSCMCSTGLKRNLLLVCRQYTSMRRYADKSFYHTKPKTWSPSMDDLVKQNVKIITSPMWMLLAKDSSGEILPSVYAKKAKEAGLKIIAWTLERSDLLEKGGGWYYQAIKNATSNNGDMLVALDILAQDVDKLCSERREKRQVLRRKVLTPVNGK